MQKCNSTKSYKFSKTNFLNFKLERSGDKIVYLEGRKLVSFESGSCDRFPESTDEAEDSVGPATGGGRATAGNKPVKTGQEVVGSATGTASNEVVEEASDT